MPVIRTLSEQAIREVSEVVRRVLGEGLQTTTQPTRNRQGMMFYVGKTDGGGLTARASTTPGTGTVTLQNISSGTLGDRTDDSSATVTKTALNLSTTAVSGDVYGLFAKEMLTGQLFNVSPDESGGTATANELYYVKTTTFFEPGDSGVSMDLQSWNGSAWVDSTTNVTCQNTNKDCCMLVNEGNWAVKLDATHYELQPFGLHREATLAADIAVGAAGNVNINSHSGGTCAGTEQGSATVSACNGTSATTATAFRQLFDNEEVFIHHFENKWHITGVTRTILLGKPTTNLQSGSSGTFNIWSMQSGSPAIWTGNTVAARNITGETFDTADLYEIHYTVNSTSPIAFPAQGEDCAA